MNIEKGYGNTGDKEGRHRIRRTENQRGELANFTKLSSRQSRPGNQWLDRPNTDFEISSVSNQKGRFDQDIQDTKTNFGNLECLEIRKDKICKFGKYKTTIYKTN